MKKCVVLTLLLLAVCLFCGTALAQGITFEGSVVAEEKAVVRAPFGGMVEKAFLRPGSLVKVGDAVARIGTTRVYATHEGKISGIFGTPGEPADSVSSRYGGVVYIEPTNKYIIGATTEKAYNSSETKYIRVGERVYLSCTKDGSHTGTAVVIALKEADMSGNTAYTLEVTGGEFYMGETVAVYRRADFAAESCIGRGNIAQNPAIPVSASGSILKMHVTEGEQVERGQLLFETVEGVLDGLYAMDNTVLSDVAGVVASVDAATGGGTSKGGSLITVYPREEFQVRITVSEFDLTEIAAGDKVFIEFEWDHRCIRRYKGQVESLSYLSTAGVTGTASGKVEYAAYIDFVPDDDVRLGMSVLVYVADEEAWDAAEDVEIIMPDEEE